MAIFSKDARQAIVQDYATRHDGVFEPSGFLDEVRVTGGLHPAFRWFEWNNVAAGDAYRLEQARDFARDLCIVGGRTFGAWACKEYVLAGMAVELRRYEQRDACCARVADGA